MKGVICGSPNQEGAAFIRHQPLARMLEALNGSGAGGEAPMLHNATQYCFSPGAARPRARSLVL